MASRERSRKRILKGNVSLNPFYFNKQLQSSGKESQNSSEGKMRAPNNGIKGNIEEKNAESFFSLLSNYSLKLKNDTKIVYREGDGSK